MNMQIQKQNSINVVESSTNMIHAPPANAKPN